jgi:short-subunit dehydrogenase
LPKQSGVPVMGEAADAPEAESDTDAARPKYAMKDGPPVIVITGASSGIGRCTAKLFAQKGWQVGLIARGEIGLQAASADVAREGATTLAIQADVAEFSALETAAAQFERRLGPIDVWVNCAGNATFGRFLDTPADEFQRVTDVTYLGTVNGTRVALQRMLPRDRGVIINVCSAVAYHGMPLMSSYSGAKHAVHGFGQSVCAELAEEGSRVRLSTVFPPAVNTPFFEHAVSHMGRAARPMPPVYQPEIVADAIYLAATSKCLEMPVSFTTILFSIGARFVPGFVRQLIRKLGYSGQLTDTSVSPNLRTTLFAASDRASPVHGRFSAEARSNSTHISLLKAWAALKNQNARASATTTSVAPESRPEVSQTRKVPSDLT